MPNVTSYAEDHRGRPVTAATTEATADVPVRPRRAPAYRGMPRMSRRRPTGPRGEAAQPWVGLAGLAVIVPVAVALSVSLGDLEDTALVLGPLTTFALPAIATIAFWWEDWPGAILRAGWVGLTDTLLVAAAGVALTVAGQAVVNGLDLRGVFVPAPGSGHMLTYPATMGLAGAAFTAMLQLTLVTEGWPLRGRDRILAGLGALAVSWVIALAAWLLLVEPGPIVGIGRETFGIWSIVLGAWQVVFYVIMHGRPFTLITDRAPRLITGNVSLLLLTAVSYAVLRGAGVEDGVIGAICGSVVGAGLVVAMLFDGWPGTRWTGVATDVVNLISVAVLTVALYAALAAFAAGATLHRVSESSWITLASLNFVGMVVILHVSVWRRWPVVARPLPGGADDKKEVANAE